MPHFRDPDQQLQEAGVGGVHAVGPDRGVLVVERVGLRGSECERVDSLRGGRSSSVRRPLLFFPFDRTPPKSRLYFPFADSPACIFRRSNRGPALAGLAIISKISPKALEEITLPLLFSKLPDSPPPLEADEDRVRYRRILSSLSVLCVQPPLFEILVVRITSKLDLLCSSTDHLLDPASPSAPRREAEGVEDLSMVDRPSRECDAVYAFALLSCLLNVLRTKVEAGHLDIPKYIDQLVPRLFTIFVLAALSTRSEQEIAADPRLVVVASRIIETVVQTLSVE